jgi:hypothetical protein
MTAVYSDIAQYIAEGKTPLQIVDLLRAESVRQNNLKQWSFGLIETQLDAETARTLAGVIQSAAASDPLMASAFTAMSTTGIELWSDARQSLIEAIGTAAGMTVDQIAQVKALGVTYTAVDADATVESVQALIDAEAARVAAEALETARMELWQTWQDVYNQNISPVLDGTEPTVANLLAGARLLVTDLEGV